MTSTFRIEIDEDACAGHGRCWTLAPDLFEARPEDGKGQVKVSQPDPSTRAEAERIVQLCPENAIRIVEIDG